MIQFQLFPDPLVPSLRRPNGSQNHERTTCQVCGQAWRDPEFSDMMRQPGNQPDHPILHYLRSCDMDPGPVCALCQCAIFLSEADAKGNLNKATTYTRTLAHRAGLPAFLFVRNLPGLPSNSYRIRDLQTWQWIGPLSRDETVAWIEKEFLLHYQRVHG